MIRKLIYITAIIVFSTQSCSSETKNDSMQNSNSEQELLSENIPEHTSEIEQSIANPEFDMQQDAWKFDVCNLWKKNDCVDPASESCKYWEPSETHLGMNPELCVKAMNATLEYCERKTAFFINNPRNCECVEEQYKKTTHRPDASKQEGPIFAKECFIEQNS